MQTTRFVIIGVVIIDKKFHFMSFLEETAIKSQVQLNKSEIIHFRIILPGILETSSKG